MSKAAETTVPQPAPFNPINIPGTANQAFAADVTGFGTSDADFLARFPGLVSSRTTDIDKSYQQLTGPLDPTLQNAFVKEGLSKSLGNLGGGNPGASLTKGSAAQNQTSATVAGRTQDYKDYARDNFSSLLASNPQRALGLSGSDVAQLSIANTGNLNSSNQAQYVAGVNRQNAENQADAQNQQAAISTALAVAGIIAAIASDERMKTDIKQVGTSPSGIPIKSFRYKGDDTMRIGAMAQDVEKVAPHAVTTDKKGMKGVKYGLIDVPFFPYARKHG